MYEQGAKSLVYTLAEGSACMSVWVCKPVKRQYISCHAQSEIPFMDNFLGHGTGFNS